MTTCTIKTRESDAAVGGGEICGICQRQVSRYTCPSCNIFYCSLKCFRSEPHSRCSEIFYRKEIEMGIKSDSTKTEGDRDKMIQLLKRIEDQSAGDELFHHSDEEDEEESLASRFSAIDISTASADDLLRLLSKRERDEFFVALKDPSSGLARKLLESEEFDKTRQLPWWDAPNDGGEPSLQLCVPYGVKPDLMEVPTNLIDQASRSVPLLYNICALLLAYAYVTRHLAISPLSSTTNDLQDRCEARKILSQSVPFLVDRKSKLLHTSLSDAVVSLWSRLDPGSIDNETTLILLGDVARLARPRRVTITQHLSGERERKVVLTADHPSAAMIMAISDINLLFGNYMDPSALLHRRNHIEMKLTFYAAHILSIPCSHLHALADGIILLSRSLGKY